MAKETEFKYVESCKGINGHDKVILKEVYLCGGQVTSWKNENGEEMLFISSKASFQPPKLTSGGIQICFPQFGSHNSPELHGCVRSRLWGIDPDPPPFTTNSCNKAFIDLILKHSEEGVKIWPKSFWFILFGSVAALLPERGKV